MKEITKEHYLAAYEILASGVVKRDRDVILTTRPKFPCSELAWPLPNGKLVWSQLRVYDERAFRLAAKGELSAGSASSEAYGKA